MGDDRIAWVGPVIAAADDQMRPNRAPAGRSTSPAPARNAYCAERRRRSLARGRNGVGDGVLVRIRLGVAAGYEPDREVTNVCRTRPLAMRVRFAQPRLPSGIHGDRRSGRSSVGPRSAGGSSKLGCGANERPSVAEVGRIELKMAERCEAPPSGRGIIGGGMRAERSDVRRGVARK